VAEDLKAVKTRGNLEGRYANYFKVGYNAYEFVIDFGQFYEGNKGAELYTRVITSPLYAKALLKTLSASIQNYEDSFGPIKEPGKGL
jgi:hypothetical protein